MILEILTPWVDNSLHAEPVHRANQQPWSPCSKPWTFIRTFARSHPQNLQGARSLAACTRCGRLTGPQGPCPLGLSTQKKKKKFNHHTYPEQCVPGNVDWTTKTGVSQRDVPFPVFHHPHPCADCTCSVSVGQRNAITDDCQMSKRLQCSKVVSGRPATQPP